jgi:hypothetical protein
LHFVHYLHWACRIAEPLEDFGNRFVAETAFSGSLTQEIWSLVTLKANPIFDADLIHAGA